MSIKVEVIEKEEKKRESPQGIKYPFVGKSTVTEIIVIFSKPGEGTVIKEAPRYTSLLRGEYCTGLIMKYFKKLEGKVIIEND